MRLSVRVFFMAGLSETTEAKKKKGGTGNSGPEEI
jgi:hypothetical protein